MFIEIRLCNQMTYFPVNTKYMHKHNVIFNKTVTKLVTILTKCFFFFPYLNPTSYLNMIMYLRIYLFAFAKYSKFICSTFQILCLLNLFLGCWLPHY